MIKVEQESVSTIINIIDPQAVSELKVTYSFEREGWIIFKKDLNFNWIEAAFVKTFVPVF